MAIKSSEVDLRAYAEVLRRRKWVIFVVVVVCVAIALVASFMQSKMYAASTEVLLTDPQQDAVFQSGTRTIDPARQLQTQIEVLKGRKINQAARKELGQRAALLARVSVNGVATTDVIRITARSTVPSVARDAADTYARVYVEARRSQSVDGLLQAATELQQKLDDVKTQLGAVDEQIAAAGNDTARVANLSTQRDALATQLTVFKQKLDQVQVDASVRGGAQLSADAALPSSPVSPRPLRNAVLAAILGAMVGVGLALLLEEFDDSIKSPEDIEHVVPGLVFLGSVPLLTEWRNRSRPRIVSLDDPNSPVSEAYRGLRTSFLFLTLRTPVRTLMFTSPMAAEGKTTTLTNLAVTLVRSGKRVVVVCCDLRRPRLHEFFGLTNDVGLTSVLLGERPISGALQPAHVAGANGGTLAVMASGPRPPNPSELLESERLREIFDVLAASADIVLVDSPPVVPVTDALVLSKHVDSAIVVASAGITSRKLLSRAVQALRQVEAPLVGIVLNNVSSEAVGYRYEYRYEPGRTRRKKKTTRGRDGKASVPWTRRRGFRRGPGRSIDISGGEPQPTARGAATGSVPSDRDEAAPLANADPAAVPLPKP